MKSLTNLQLRNCRKSSFFKERLDEELALENAYLQARYMDVVRVGNLFDNILKYVPDEKKGK